VPAPSFSRVQRDSATCTVDDASVSLLNENVMYGEAAPGSALISQQRL
jgi:hypothetical protein